MTDNPAMNCPVCRVPLVMSERQGVEIDYCQQCRGVWLDRGELDKIIERSARDLAPPPPPQQSAPPLHQPRPGRHDHDRDYHYGHKKRRKSFLEELFD
ncbi:zf-TFIIB domain-containing protein [Sphingosinicella terrae]|uniref:TFIIB-type zinc ribbon-containing protein n=1 Tax=Sphingosinicella terrae TaxID=2172047 RepID=UPI000E0DF99D|nr:zf-TFIIB domain-containing protein [Sphingosinicella terrae]